MAISAAKTAAMTAENMSGIESEVLKMNSAAKGTIKNSNRIAM